MIVPKTQTEVFPDYTFDLDELIKWVKKNKIKFLAVQLPAGLILSSAKLLEMLEEKLKIGLVLLADPCFGGCDLPAKNRLQRLGVDAVVQFGHSEIPNCSYEELPIKHVPLQSKTNPAKILKKDENLKKLKTAQKPPATIGLLASIQFIDYLPNIRSLLESNDYKVKIGTGDSRVKYPGQVLGCNFSVAKSIQSQVDAFLFIGDGQFHPLGASLATKKKVLAFDPYLENVQNVTFKKDKILRQRAGAIARAKACNSFGIIISTKPGQARHEYAVKLQKKLKKHGYYATLIILDHISPEKLDHLPIDAYINTACPRLSIDDYLQYKKVMLTPLELEIILGERTWNEYLFDEIY